MDICQDGMAVFVDGEEEVALWCESDSGYVLAVGER